MICLVGTEITFRATAYLDNRCDWIQRPFTRTCLQLLCAIILPFWVMYKADQWVYVHLGFQRAFPFLGLYILFLNIYYICCYLLYKDQNNFAPSDQFKQTILVNKGINQVPLSVSMISHIKREGNHVYIVTFEEQAFVTMQTLDEMQQSLNPKFFFRANRQVIVNYSACIHFGPDEHRKIKLEITPKTASPIIIGQRKVKAFKEWMER